jgi:hypothetical protein
MAILGLDRLGTPELIVCAIVALWAFADRIEAGGRALWRRLMG